MVDRGFLDEAATLISDVALEWFLGGPRITLGWPQSGDQFRDAK